MIGLEDPDVVYLIDFGIASKYRHFDGTHKQREFIGNFTGNILFASINACRGNTKSRKDDLESLLYLLGYLLYGSLPWMHYYIKDFNELRRFRCKKDILQSFVEQCPRQMRSMLKYVLNLQFYEDPDYQYLDYQLQLLAKSFNGDNINLEECNFEWVKTEIIQSKLQQNKFKFELEILGVSEESKSYNPINKNQNPEYQQKIQHNMNQYQNDKKSNYSQFQFKSKNISQNSKNDNNSNHINNSNMEFINFRMSLGKQSNQKSEGINNSNEEDKNQLNLNIEHNSNNLNLRKNHSACKKEEKQFFPQFKNQNKLKIQQPYQKFRKGNSAEEQKQNNIYQDILQNDLEINQIIQMQDEQVKNIYNKVKFIGKQIQENQLQFKKKFSFIENKAKSQQYVFTNVLSSNQNDNELMKNYDENPIFQKFNMLESNYHKNDLQQIKEKNKEF